mmetsp:Transcript_9369/g.17005  ORF Transcript_9369/g.17005 Transcript_9369/m.17005 type:complete len:80 (+) Transcript_9369:323-562(+)
MDHGQGALRGFAKIHLAWPKHLIKNTAIPLLNNSIDHLQGRKCIIVTYKAKQLKKRIIDSVHQGSKRNLTRLQNGGESQ